MHDDTGSAAAPPSRSDILRILSPLLLFAAHVVYLVAWSPDPFLKKWLDGSFTFFVALVLCNIIRSRVAASSRSGGAAGDEDPDHPEPPPAGPPSA